MQEVVKDVKKENVSLKRGIEDKENKINELNIQIDNFENFITTSLNVLNQIQLKHRDAIALKNL
jgi:predicted RNase H-like nuclease (RuvC/YqgF family)